MNIDREIEQAERRFFVATTSFVAILSPIITLALFGWFGW